MWQKISIRIRVYSLLSALVMVTLAGGVVMVWYTYQMELLLAQITEKHLVAFQAAEALETALVNQKGFVSYYFLDGDPDWLQRLGEYRQIFSQRLIEAKRLADDEESREAIAAIEESYQAYVRSKDQVIAYHQAGARQASAALHQKVRDQFFSILARCEDYKSLQNERIQATRAGSAAQAKKLRGISGAAMLIIGVLSFFLVFVLVNQILGPISQLTRRTDRGGSGTHPEQNEIKALSRSVDELMEDVDQSRSELEKSREHLMQAEKMALVGKLAAGMAHSIRNPFTSVKMRLFSLDRSLELSETQKEDFQVISDEIRHIDKIVQNFLEFSRPPKLVMQRISLSAVVDLVIQLLSYRLKSYDTNVRIMRKKSLPEIEADPEQLKEVLVNLLVNACEAMGRGGEIVIEERTVDTPGKEREVIVRISDNGPGIPANLIDKVLQPFFTTKDEGTGLGLSIAARIIEEHRGRLEITSTEGRGTTFAIRLPLAAQGEKS